MDSTGVELITKKSKKRKHQGHLETHQPDQPVEDGLPPSNSSELAKQKKKKHKKNKSESTAPDAELALTPVQPSTFQTVEEGAEAKAARKAAKKAAKRAAKQAKEVAAVEQVSAQVVEDEAARKTARKAEKKARRKSKAQEEGEEAPVAGPAPVEAQAQDVVMDDQEELERVKALRKAENKARKESRKKALRDSSVDNVEILEPEVVSVEKKKDKKKKGKESEVEVVPVEVEEEREEVVEKQKKGKKADKEVVAPAEKEKSKEKSLEKGKGKEKAVEKEKEKVVGKGKGKGPVNTELSPEDFFKQLQTRSIKPLTTTPKASTSTPKPKPSTSTSKPSSTSKSTTSKKSPSKVSIDQASLISSLHGLTPVDILSSRWYTPSDLRAISEAYNFTPLVTRFTSSEIISLQTGLKKFGETHDLTDEEVTKLIFTPRLGTQGSLLAKEFWPTLAKSVPMRPIMSVYKAVRRMRAPEGNQGIWKANELVLLESAVKKLGRQWVEVGKLVGRTAEDCRDRWRQDGGVEEKTFGKWTDEEVGRLRELVDKFGKNWTAVAKALGGRNPKQVADKWMALTDPKPRTRNPDPRPGYVPKISENSSKIKSREFITSSDEEEEEEEKDEIDDDSD